MNRPILPFQVQLLALPFKSFPDQFTNHHFNTLLCNFPQSSTQTCLLSVDNEFPTPKLLFYQVKGQATSGTNYFGKTPLIHLLFAVESVKTFSKQAPESHPSSPGQNNCLAPLLPSFFLPLPFTHFLSLKMQS